MKSMEIVSRFMAGETVAKLGRELWERTAVWPEDPGDMDDACRKVENTIRRSFKWKRSTWRRVIRRAEREEEKCRKF